MVHRRGVGLVVVVVVVVVVVSTSGSDGGEGRFGPTPGGRLGSRIGVGGRDGSLISLVFAILVSPSLVYVRQR